MWSMAKQSIRHRRGSFAGVALALLLASALLTALGVLVESGLRGGVAPSRLAGADVVVSAHQAVPSPGDVAAPLAERVTLPAGAVATVAALPGVARAVGDVTVPLTTRDGQALQGHAWATSTLAPWTLVEGSAPANAHEVVLESGQGHSVGDTVALANGDVFGDYTISGLVELKGVAAGSSRKNDVVFLADERAVELTPHEGTVEAIGIVVADGASVAVVTASVREALPGASVVSGRSRGDVETLDGVSARSNLTMMGSSFAGFTTLVVVFVVASTVALSVAQRRREFALVRAVGARPRQILGMVVREVALVAAVAGVAGVVPGYLLAKLMGDKLASTGVVPPGFSMVYGPLAAVVAVALCLSAAIIAALVAARKPAMTEPIDALRESHTERPEVGRGRGLTGLGMIGLGLVASGVPAVVKGVAGLASVGGAVILILVGVGLAGPLVVTATLRIVGPLLRRGADASSVLADASMRHFSRRVASAVVPLALAVAFSGVQLLVTATSATEAARQSKDGMIADLLVAAPSGGLAQARVEQMTQVPGVVHVNPVVRSTGLVPMSMAGDVSWEPASLQGIDPQAVAATLDLSVVDGSLERLAGIDTVAVSEDTARAAGTAVGKTFAYRLGDGTPAEATVVATYKRGLGFGDVTLAQDVLRAHTTSGLADYVLVDTSTGDAQSVASELTAKGFVTLDRDAIAAAGHSDRAFQAGINLVAVAVILGYVALSVVNSLVMATSARRGEFELLKLTGASRRQVLRMTGIESIITSGLALAVGVAAAVAPLMGVAIGISGRPVPTFLPMAALVIGGLTVAVGVGSTRVATLAALRTAARQ